MLVYTNYCKIYIIINRWAYIIREGDDEMMILTMANVGETNTIKRIGGKAETKKFLENLGFVTGGNVTVISEVDGNMILNVKNSRIALGKDMANRIMVE